MGPTAPLTVPTAPLTVPIAPLIDPTTPDFSYSPTTHTPPSTTPPTAPTPSTAPPSPPTPTSDSMESTVDSTMDKPERIQVTLMLRPTAYYLVVTISNEP